MEKINAVEKPSTENKSKFKQINVEKFKIDFSQVLDEKTQIWDIDSKVVQKSYDKILEIWNKDEKSQAFVKHLINAFLPFDTCKKAFSLKAGENNRCAILGNKLSSIGEVSEHFGKFSTEKLFVDAKCMSENRTLYTEEESKKLNDFKNKMPVEIRTCSIAMISDKSTKLIQTETAYALNQFCIEMLLKENKTLLYRERSDIEKAFNENKKVQPKPLSPPQTKVAVGNMISDESLDKLEKLKQSLSK